MSIKKVQRRILVCDDEPDMTLLLSEYLRHHNFAVSVLTDPRKVISSLESQFFDLTLMDIMMPHLTGLEVSDLIRQHSTLSNMPIILLSAKVLTREERISIRKKKILYMRKPVMQSHLLERILELLS